MTRRKIATPRVMVFGVGAFAHGVMSALSEAGAEVSAYLTRDYGRYGPGLCGRTYSHQEHPNPIRIIDRDRPACVVPMAIEWALKPWAKTLRERSVPILCPAGNGLLLERDRDYARKLCRSHHIPVAEAFVAKTRQDARRRVQREGKPFVIKNPLCSPFSPVHTIVCETVDDTLAWLERVDDSEGIYLQEYIGRREAGHIALVSAGEIHSLVTNQEYKRAYDGNLGIVAGAPMGGIVEQDPDDRYGLARELLLPLQPWFRSVNYHGPVQVTAVQHRGRWRVIEYNVRLGVTCGPIVLRMLKDPVATVIAASKNEPIRPTFHKAQRFGCSLTLAGFGYPYVTLSGPRLPVDAPENLSGHVWWGEVAGNRQGTLTMTGHRLADVAGLARTLPAAIAKAYRTIRQIRCLGSYYRLDVGQSLWPPGTP